MDYNIPLILCSPKTVVHVQVSIFAQNSQIVCRNGANGIKPGSNSKMKDKHTALFPKPVCLELN